MWGAVIDGFYLHWNRSDGLLGGIGRGFEPLVVAFCCRAVVSIQLSLLGRSLLARSSLDRLGGGNTGSGGSGSIGST
jgi:hypothetical protein